MEKQREISKQEFDKCAYGDNDARLWQIWKKAFDIGVNYEKERNEKNEDFISFHQYLIMVGIRSIEYTYSDDVIFSNIEYFRKCHSQHLSAYKALLFFNDYLKSK